MPACNTRKLEFPQFVASGPDSVATYDVYELSLRPTGSRPVAAVNPFFDVRVTGELISPNNQRVPLNGFYYGRDTWMIRFQPDAPGRWRYRYTVAAGNDSSEGSGAFTAIASNSPGRLTRSAGNPFRWLFSNGRPFFPRGIQDCIGNQGANIVPISIDGEGRSDPARTVSIDDHFAIYGKAGFNLFRFSQRNCSYPIFTNLEEYRVDESIATDTLLAAARRHGFRIFFGFFGYHGIWHDGTLRMRVRSAIAERFGWSEGLDRPGDQRVVAGEKRFVDYAIARWGPFVDFWQLVNERKADDRWTTEMANYVKSVDPLKRPVGTSWERPQLAAIDLMTPHWYESESELESDLRVAQQADKWKVYGKPVLVGEHGNTGMNWDPGSARRLRIRMWTAMFEDIGLILWNTSWSKAGMYGGKNTPDKVANIYLGPEERRQLSVLKSVSDRLDADVKEVAIPPSRAGIVRTYGLIGNTKVLAYVHHFADHTTPVSDLSLSLPLAEGSWRGQWIEPATGTVKGEFVAVGGRPEVIAPSFTVDIAVILERQ